MVNENIKKARETAGISQRELGRRINKTGQYISYLEKNPKSNPSIVVLSDIATVLNIPLSHLIESQETLTNKIIRTLEINFDTDAENTLELICELVDIDPEVIDQALKENEDISESYLSKMISIIYKDNPDLFANFYIENIDLINNNYLICAQTCDEIIKNIKLEKDKNFNSTTNKKILSPESFEIIKRAVDKSLPSLSPIIQFLANPKVEIIYGYSYNDLAAYGYQELLFIAIEKAISTTLFEIREHQKKGDLFDGLSSWISKESPVYEMLKKSQENNRKTIPKITEKER